MGRTLANPRNDHENEQIRQLAYNAGPNDRPPIPWIGVNDRHVCMRI